MSRVLPRKGSDLWAPRLHHCLTKGVKTTPCPTLSIPSALRNSFREEELKRSCLTQQSPPSVSQIPGLFWGSPVNRHLSNTSGVLIWKLVWNCVLFSFSFFKETKGEGWEVKHHPPKSLRRLQASSSRERVKVGIMYQPVCPEESKESSSWWTVDEGGRKSPSPAIPLPRGRRGIWNHSVVEAKAGELKTGFTQLGSGEDAAVLNCPSTNAHS